MTNILKGSFLSTIIFKRGYFLFFFLKIKYIATEYILSKQYHCQISIDKITPFNYLTLNS